MKGIVFTEFLDMVEAAFGIETSESIIESAALASGGAYTSVGTYDHREMLRLVQQLSASTGRPVPDLVKAYGTHLFGRFLTKYPGFFEKPRNAFEFLGSIEQTIHVEVLKLHPDAELPRFDSTIDGNRMTLLYRSSRPFADLAEGLISACIAHYGESIEFTREDLDGGAGTHARFTLTKHQ